VSQKQREGVVVTPRNRLTEAEVKLVDETSRELLEDPGLISYSKEAADLFAAAGAKVEDDGKDIRVHVPSSLVDKVLETAPSTIVLGARNPDNRLILDASEPRVRFGSGSETNIWLEAKFEGTEPKFVRHNGSIERLGMSAHLADNLENLDFFIRNVNIRDPEITKENKDANKFGQALDNITKHVQAGLTDIDALDDIVRLGRIVAGGESAFVENPVLSFIACVVKSPFQIVDDTAAKLIAIARKNVPVVVSSSPMGGATAPFDEFGMVAQINAELLAGIAITQLANPGAPVLYGAVPIRTRLDNLNDMYGAPEFNHYNMDCVQMARHYNVPCYSTAGVGDTDRPGIQATVEKLTTLIMTPTAGAQYVHYAFGLLERTNMFSPEQAVMDDAHIGMIKHMMKDTTVSADRKAETLAMIREVMQSDHRTYVYNLPLPTRDYVYVRYPLEDEAGGGLLAAHRKYKEIMDKPRQFLPEEVRNEIRAKVPGILPQTMKVGE